MKRIGDRFEDVELIEETYMSDDTFWKQLKARQTQIVLKGLEDQVTEQDLIDLFYVLDTHKERRVDHKKFLRCVMRLDGVGKSIYAYALYTMIEHVLKRVDGLCDRTGNLCARIDGLASRVYEDFESHFDAVEETKAVRK